MVSSSSTHSKKGDMDNTSSQGHLRHGDQEPYSRENRGQSAYGPDRADMAAMLARLNVLSSQIHAQYISLENQRIITKETEVKLNKQQDQVNVILYHLNVQRVQQERTVGMLEELIAKFDNTANNPQENIPSAPPTNTSEPAATQAPGTTVSEPKRLRGRPRVKCSMCKQKKPIQENLTLCNDCAHYLAPIIAPINGEKRDVAAVEDPIARQQISKRPRLTLSQDIGSRNPDIEHTEAMPVPIRPGPQPNGSMVIIISPKNMSERVAVTTNQMHDDSPEIQSNLSAEILTAGMQNKSSQPPAATALANNSLPSASSKNTARSSTKGNMHESHISSSTSTNGSNTGPIPCDKHKRPVMVGEIIRADSGGHDQYSGQQINAGKAEWQKQTREVLTLKEPVGADYSSWIPEADLW